MSMRASKETAEHSLNTVQRILKGQTVATSRLEYVADFLKAAKRKLPTEAAYDADKKRRRSKKEPW